LTRALQIARSHQPRAQCSLSTGVPARRIDSRAPARPESRRAFHTHIRLSIYVFDGYRLICPPSPKAFTRIPSGYSVQLAAAQRAPFASGRRGKQRRGVRVGVFSKRSCAQIGFRSRFV